METPLNSLPTDNLYKFLTLSGLALIIFSIWHYDQRADAASLAFAEVSNANRLVSTRHEVFEATFKLWNSKFTHLEKELDRLAPTNSLTDVQVEKAKLLMAAFDDLGNELPKYLEDNLLKKDALQYKLDLANMAQDKEKQAYNQFRDLFRTGVSLSIFGFALWYLRVQVFQDRILRNDADKRSTSHKKTKQNDTA
jgi:hypothetical protein